MGRGPCTFKEIDVMRALRAAKKAGVGVCIEIDLEQHVMRLIPVVSSGVDVSESKLTPDDELEAWRQKKNAR
jgi:hypothetical protein